MLTFAARVHNMDEALQCLAMGFDQLEISLPCPGGMKEEKAWADLAGRKKIGFWGHGPKEGDPQNLPNLENHYLPRLKQAIEAGARLNCYGLTIHLWLEPRWIDKSTISKKIKLLAKVAAWGRGLGVPVNLENLSEHWTDLESPLTMIEGLGLTLDVGHAQLLHPNSAAFGIIEHLYPYLNHLHLHDNHGGNSPNDDLHLPPGQGCVPFADIFARLKKHGYNKSGTLELKPQEMPEARDWIREAWANA